MKAAYIQMALELASDLEEVVGGSPCEFEKVGADGEPIFLACFKRAAERSRRKKNRDMASWDLDAWGFCPECLALWHATLASRALSEALREAKTREGRNAR